MKLQTLFVFTLVTLFLNAGSLSAQEAGATGADEPKGKTLTEKSSYLLGYNFFMDFKTREIELDMEQILAGMKDAAAGRDAVLSKEEIAAVETAFRKLIASKEEELFKRAADKNMRDGEQFLKQNALAEGVKQFESGLQIQVLSSGEGSVPKASDMVRVHYKGTLVDGTPFDGTRTEPATFGVSGVIRGMTEALQKMKVGDKWKIFVPANLAYGVQGYPAAGIGPNQTLIFELELVDIVKPNR